MRVFVITKRMLLLGGGVLLLLGVILAVSLLGDREEQTTQTMSSGMDEQMYELAVLAGKKKELPVYSVAREDKKIALTIDAACAEASMW